MREIKFRAWKDNSNWGMLKHKDLKFDTILCEKQEDDFHLMQYTGLKDKNGKEIYEGDIVKFENGKDSWVVEWNTIFSYSYWTSSKNDIIVIGNIYENPELFANAVNEVNAKYGKKGCGNNTEFWHNLENKTFWKCGESDGSDIFYCDDCNAKSVVEEKQ